MFYYCPELSPQALLSPPCGVKSLVPRELPLLWAQTEARVQAGVADTEQGVSGSRSRITELAGAALGLPAALLGNLAHVCLP